MYPENKQTTYIKVSVVSISACPKSLALCQKQYSLWTWLISFKKKSHRGTKQHNHNINHHLTKPPGTEKHPSHTSQIHILRTNNRIIHIVFTSQQQSFLFVCFLRNGDASRSAFKVLSASMASAGSVYYCWNTMHQRDCAKGCWYCNLKKHIIHATLLEHTKADDVTWSYQKLTVVAINHALS